MIDIGETIKKYRKRSGMTLSELSEKSGLSASFLSKLEAGKLGISVSNLDKIAEALGFSMLFLMSDNEETLPLVSFKKSRSKLMIGDGIEYQNLSPIQANFNLSSSIVTVPFGVNSGETTSHHGDETHYIIKGKFKFVIGEQEFILEEGDAISNHAENPHSWENIGEEEGVFLVIGSMPPNLP